MAVQRSGYCMKCLNICIVLFKHLRILVKPSVKSLCSSPCTYACNNLWKTEGVFFTFSVGERYETFSDHLYCFYMKILKAILHEADRVSACILLFIHVARMWNSSLTVFIFVIGAKESGKNVWLVLNVILEWWKRECEVRGMCFSRWWMRNACIILGCSSQGKRQHDRQNHTWADNIKAYVNS